MKQAKVISLKQYRPTEAIEGSSSLPGVHAVILDFSSRGAEIVERKRVTARATERALLLLEGVAALARDYEAQMLCIANQMTREEWQEKHQCDPYAQIEFDMVRLGRMKEALEYALRQRGARTLKEACEMALSWRDEEVRSTLDYILSSDYYGFEAMRRLIFSAGFEGFHYTENLNDLYKLFRSIQENNFVYSIPVLSTLFLDQAVAV